MDRINSLDKGTASKKAVAIWLLAGVIMIMIQVLLGGITRLTESGLSITEWKPVTGILPPLSQAKWMEEFDKYKSTDQFKYVHQYFSLSDFKHIFFWEWFHRVWARLMGLVFIAGFVYFAAKKKFSKEMVLPMVVLFLLGAVQGAIGWIMVKSGLVPEKYYVGHVELATHFIAALGLLCYTLWFALSLLVPKEKFVINKRIRKGLLLALFLLVLQLIYGGFMAGLKAAVTAPTWPDINGTIIPPGTFSTGRLLYTMVNDPLAVHFIHRSIAYLLVLLIAGWWACSARVLKKNNLAGAFRNILFLLVLVQVILGILTVLNATHHNRLIGLGVAHQCTAMLLLADLICLLFIVREQQKL